MLTSFRLLGAALSALVLATVPAWAQAVRYEAVTFDATSTGFTASTLNPATGGGQLTLCEGKLETGDIRIRFDGTAPTASEGTLVEVGNTVRVSGAANLRAFRGIRTGGTSGIIRFHCSNAPALDMTGSGNTSGTIELVDGDNDPLTDDPNNALKVSIVAGAASGTTDTDDGSIAAGQATVGLALGLNQFYNGTAWVRMLGNATDGLLVNLGANNDVTVTGTVTATGPLTDAQLRATAVPVSGTVTATGPLTDAQLRATAVPISGTVTANLGATDNAVLDDIADGIAVTNGGTFAVQAAQTGNWTARLADGAGNALTSLVAGAERAITVSVVDSSGNHVSSFGGSGGTSSAFGAAFPSGASSGTAIGFYDGTNMQAGRVIDADTGAGTFYTTATNLVRRVSGTPTELIGQAAMAASLPVTLASDQSTLPVSLASVPSHAVTNAGTFATQAAQSGTWTVQPGNTANTTAWLVTGTGGTFPSTQSGTWNVGTVTTVSAVTAITNALPAGTNNIGDVDILSFPDNEPFNISQMNGVAVTMGNGASGTGVQRVSIANDSTGVLASITTSIVPGTGATHLGKAEDAAHTTADTGVVFLSRRIDTLASSTVTSGDYATINTDSLGAVWVNPMPPTPVATSYLPVRISADGTNFATLGADYTQDAALTVATTAGPMTIGRASASAPTNVSAGDDAVSAWYLLNGSAVTNLAAGGTLITATSTSLNVACTTGCSSTSFTDDAAFTVAGSSVVPIAGVFATDSVDAGDAGAVRMSANRNLFTTLRDAAGNERGVNVDASNALLVAQTGAIPAGTNNIGDVDIATITAGDTDIGNVDLEFAGTAAAVNNGVVNAQTLRVTIASDSTGQVALVAGGDVDLLGSTTAHDAVATSVNPILVGAYASQAAPTNVSADGDSVRLWALRNGSLVANMAAGGTLITSTGSALDTTVTNTVTVAAHAVTNAGTFVVQENGGALTALQLIDNAVSGAGFNITQFNGAAVPLGAGVEATALRVTLATDSTGLVSIDDNGGSLTIDGTVAISGTVTVAAHAVTNAGTFATQIDGAALTALQLIDNSIFADDAVFTLASSSVTMAGAVRDDSLSTLTAVEGDAVPLRVNATGALHVTGGGGGTEFAEDTAHSTGATGSLPFAVRNDAGTALAGDGDYIPLMANASGALYVTGGGGGTEYVVNAVAPADPTGATFTMERDDALSALTEIEGDWTNPRSNANGALWTVIDGTVTVASHAVTNAGTFAVQESGAALTALQLIDNAISGAGFNITQFNGAAVPIGAGTEAAALRVTLATDSTGLVSVDDNGGSLTIDGSLTTVSTVTTVSTLTTLSQLGGVALPIEDATATNAGVGIYAMAVRRDTAASSADATGENATLNTDATGYLWTRVGPELPAGTQNIGDVDIASALPGGTNNIGDVDVLTLPSVTIGTFPDNEPFNISQMNGVTVLMGNGVTGTGSQRVTIASDNTAFTVNAAQSGTWNVGTVTTLTTLSQLGGVALPVEDAAETAAGVGIYAMGVRRDTIASSAGATGDNTMASYDSLGRMWVRPASPCDDHARVSDVVIDTATSGNVQLVALNGSDVFYVCGFNVLSTAAQSVQFISGTGTACATGETDETGPYAFAANGGISVPNTGAVQFTTAAGAALCIELSAASQVSGMVTYVRTAAP